MLLYITAEDIFGSNRPERKGPKPLHTMPETLSGLYDMGMRHHVRKAALSWAAGEGFEPCPDWKLDRLVIRVALYSRENLGLEPGTRVAVFGRFGWLWPVVDFAATGFGAASVGIAHDASDEAVVAALGEAQPRVTFAADPESAARLLPLRASGRLPQTTLVAEGLTEGEHQLALEKLLDLGGTLDTPERAQAFRLVSRSATSEAPALWHADGISVERLSHKQAMAWLAPRLRRHPAQAGDVAYVEGPRASLALRLAVCGFVGDGLTATALGREGRTSEDVVELAPHKMRVSGTWLRTACDGRGPRWPAGLDRARAGRRVREVLGARLRGVETDAAAGESASRALAAAGVTLESSDGPEPRGSVH
jgi:hypothetical protein